MSLHRVSRLFVDLIGDVQVLQSQARAIIASATSRVE